MEIKSIYDNSEKVQTKFTEKTRTRQEFESECNINNIVKKARVTGFLTDPLIPRTRIPTNGDFSNAPDFLTAQNLLIEAQNAFLELSPDVRARFGNDPANLVNFVSDDKNAEEIIRLGLGERRVPEKNETVESIRELGKILQEQGKTAKV